MLPLRLALLPLLLATCHSASAADPFFFYAENTGQEEAGVKYRLNGVSQRAYLGVNAIHLRESFGQMALRFAARCARRLSIARTVARHFQSLRRESAELAPGNSGAPSCPIHFDRPQHRCAIRVVRRRPANLDVRCPAGRRRKFAVSRNRSRSHHIRRNGGDVDRHGNSSVAREEAARVAGDSRRGGFSRFPLSHRFPGTRRLHDRSLRSIAASLCGSRISN